MIPTARSLRSLALVTGLSAVPALHGAIVFEDDFSTGPINPTNWDLGTLSEIGSGSFETGADGALGMVTGGPVSGVRPNSRINAVTTLPQSSDWTVTVTMNLAALADLSPSLAGGDGVVLTVQVRSAFAGDDRLEVNFAAINFGSPGYAVRSADRLDGVGNINEPIINLPGSAASTATLVLTYNATSQTSRSAYSFNGGPLTNFGFVSDLSGWTTGAGDLFEFQLEALSGNLAGSNLPLAGTIDLAAGEAAFDNFRLEDVETALPAVPEPSVALLGGLSLLVVFRRRSR